MKFGSVRVDEAEGAVLAHATLVGNVRLRKAHRVTREDVLLLKEAGIESVIAARLAPEDLNEDEAADKLAQALLTQHVDARPPSTGRVNLHAAVDGLFTVDAAAVNRINSIDPAVTLATLAPFTSVRAGQMVATVKIIPFAVAESLVSEAVHIAAGTEAVFSVKPFKAQRVGVIQTVLPTLKASVLDKTARITAERLARSGSIVSGELRPVHDEETVAKAICSALDGNDMLLVFGASAVCDEDDVIPAAIRRAGGAVARVGMPVDPGNLLVLGAIDGKPIIGAPGCARSAKTNGFDWILDRLMAGMDITSTEIAGMGVGGLLAEIPSRPQPREAAKKQTRPVVWGVLLAAGQSRRMGAKNKLLAEFGGVPLVRRTAAAMVESRIEGGVVVLGYEAGRIAAVLEGLELGEIINDRYADGLSTSLRAGIDALPEKAVGALIMLADMPDVTVTDLNRLIDSFCKTGGTSVVRATYQGKRGNPVLLPRALFAEVARLQGDTGARHVVEAGLVDVIDVELGAAAHLDVDTPEALEKAGGILV